MIFAMYFTHLKTLIPVKRVKTVKMHHLIDPQTSYYIVPIKSPTLFIANANLVSLLITGH